MYIEERYHYSSQAVTSQLDDQNMSRPHQPWTAVKGLFQMVRLTWKLCMGSRQVQTNTKVLCGLSNHFDGLPDRVTGYDVINRQSCHCSDRCLNHFLIEGVLPANQIVNKMAPLVACPAYNITSVFVQRDVRIKMA